MSTKMTERDWKIALEVFRGCLPRRGDKSRRDRQFLEALHYFSGGPYPSVSGIGTASGNGSGA
jgi:hypothetical protein